MWDITLLDARLKLDWANRQLDLLREEIEARQDYRITVEANADAGEYVFRVGDLGDLNPDWGLRIGDCLTNARAALDFLMVRIVCLATGDHPRDVRRASFPIYEYEEEFRIAWEQLSKAMHGRLGDCLTRIEELQPFNNGDPSIWARRSIDSSTSPTCQLRWRDLTASAISTSTACSTPSGTWSTGSRACMQAMISGLPKASSCAQAGLPQGR